MYYFCCLLVYLVMSKYKDRIYYHRRSVRLCRLLELPCKWQLVCDCSFCYRVSSRRTLDSSFNNYSQLTLF